MTNLRETARGISKMAGGTIAVRVITLAFGVAVARLLGPDDFGVFISMLAAAELAGMAADIGLGTIVSRISAEVDGELAIAALRHALVIRWTLTLVASVPLVAYVLVTRGAGYSGAAAALVIYVLVNGAMVLARQWAVGRFRFGLASVSLVTAQAALLVFGVAAILLGFGVFGLVIAEVAGSALGLAVLLGGGWQELRAVFRPGVRGTAPHWSELLRQAAPLGVAGLLSGMYSRYDVLLVAALAGDRGAGMYAAAYQPFLVACALAQVAYSVMVPVTAKSRAVERSGDAGSIQASLAIGWVVGLALFAAGPLAVRLLFGARYAPSVPVMRVLALAVTFLFFSNVLMARAVAERRTNIVLGVSLGAVVSTVAIDLALVPQLGPLGAAVATVIVEAGIAAALAVSVRPSEWRRSAGQWVRAGLVPLLAIGVVTFGHLPEWPLLGLVAFMAFPYVRTLT